MTIEKRSIPTTSPTPSRWPGEAGFFYSTPPEEIGQVLEAYPYSRTPRSWVAIITSLLVGGAGGFACAAIAHKVVRGDDFYETIGAMIIGGIVIAFAAYKGLQRVLPLNSEAIFIGRKGIAQHSVAFGRQTERVVKFDPAHPPHHRVEVTQIKSRRLEWKILEWQDGGERVGIRVERLIPIAELAYADATTA